MIRINIHYFHFFILLLCQPVFAQNKKVIDSLQSILASEKHDTVKIYALVILSSEYSEFDRQKAFEFAKQALTFSKKADYKEGMGLAHNGLGDLYWFMGDYATSSDHYFKALKIYEDLNDKPGMAQCYRNIGWIYQGQQNYPLTVEYYLKSLKINEELGLKPRLIANYDDLGIVYKLMKKFPEALDYCQRTIRLSTDIGSQKGVATSYGNLGLIHYAMGNYELAIESFKTSNNIHREFSDNYNMAEGNIGLASCYLKLRKADKTIEYAEKALLTGTELNFRTIVSDAYHRLAFAYSYKKDFAKAFKYIELFAALQDSTYNENNSQQINEMSAKYESEKKELMINSLEKDKAISGEKLKKDQNFKIYLIIFCLMIAIFSFFLFRGIQHKKKANGSLSKAYKEIEVKNKDITDSISYAKRIQDASLPPKELRHKLFPDSFILFKPKDIVSGDFYWYAEKNGKKLIAACDCTGHGVPGALMSMIGNNILNQIVNEKGITSAGEILTQLNIEIRKSLKQNEQTENRDGMDIALIVFNSETEIEFAGAQRPLWVISGDKTSDKGMITEIKGNKFSIGGIQTENERIFSTHSLKLHKENAIYISTDGYADQFGGRDEKKLMTKNMKALLTEIYDRSMNAQHDLLETTIEEWKGKSEQVDDILVIGIKIG